VLGNQTLCFLEGIDVGRTDSGLLHDVGRRLLRITVVANVAKREVSRL
jgi:hypothetical protein